MIVMKFGGTSVGSAERIKQAAGIIRDNIELKPVVVLSAVGGITDKLIEAGNKAVLGHVSVEEIRKKHKEILSDLGLDTGLVDAELLEFENHLKGISMLKELSLRSMDLVQCFGERMSVKIMAAHMQKLGIKAKAFNSYDLGFLTDSNFGEATPDDNSYPEVNKNIIDYINQGGVPLITGFIGKDSNGAITTLGRGGSDYTAALIGLIIEADEIQIWTDVDGVLSCDPKMASNVKNIEELSFNEAAELSFFGAKVLHPKTIWPAVEKNIPVKVLNTHNPTHPGTTILKQLSNVSCNVKVLSFKKNVTLVNIHSLRMLQAHGFLAKIFDIFARHNISVDMIATSEVSVSLTIDKIKHLDKAVVELSEFSEVNIYSGKAIICLVGEGIKSNHEVAGAAFETLAREGINTEMISQGSSEINIGFVIDMKSLEIAVKALHEIFFE